MTLPRKVRIVEVGPRDGLQNESVPLSADVKVALIEQLAAAGLQTIEAGAFVSPKWVPQMADTAEVLAAIDARPGVSYPVLVPNLRGLDAALAAGVTEISVFAAASETFSQRNINCSIGESLKRFAEVTAKAHKSKIRIRAYISCVLGCPYEGAVSPTVVTDLATRLADLGCYEVSLGDTIGVGTPLAARRLVETVGTKVPIERLAVHFHDTYGQALANIYATLDLGISVIDSAIAGLGGCPYAPGASGNAATEDVLYMLQGLGIETGIDLDKLLDAGAYITAILGRKNQSKAATALLNRLDQAQRAGTC
ncbi:hydroxymethylglutaryl-CoA lyase [Dongia soli]|uniref:Hydroxymethylglutaryl-CoA lyase n=1 Tax=Dongia soli TaxID=600628 RepID=A0ABU5E8U9_9PROT|nr:hydroxymethylglutaryl-CoA lyase [Dongia soli]MDY0882748.1 hydroxymethylglutaryl-CoA lyase [Dongia soli]